ncbi:patatin-like phospholipase family protein [Roseobacter sp. HKCCA0434]|uniref:patatin-like phospholipase family protein n=1 Tax=Roseobacter sp. HKCCA0434 TaxID=3079297 RepID=UPI002905D63D|nr:patatin-like phospholipase family protein [Roseobacter sp. HKCCA0434]
MPPSERFPDLVFGGGGTRCFWHGGYLTTLAPILAPTRRINAVSGGVLSALAHVTGQEHRLLFIAGRAFERLQDRGGNLRFRNLLKAEALLPHQDTYREIVATLMDSPDAVAAVADGPEFTVHLAKPSRIGNLATIAVYGAEVPLRGTPHVRGAQRLGAKLLTVDARQAARDGRIVDLTVAAAASAPVFAKHFWDDQRVMDGGVLDNAPAFDDSDDQLLLVTRCYPNLPEVAGRTYALPGRDIETFKLDFTDREGIEAAWELGEKDAEVFLAEHARK